MTLTATQVDEKLKGLRSLGDVREFITQLGFAYANDTIPTRGFKQELLELIDAKTLSVIGRADVFPIVFVQAAKHKKGDADRHLIRVQRALIPKLPPEIQDACIVIVASADFTFVHFVNAKRTGKRLMLRRFLTGGEHKTRTAADRLALLQIAPADKWADIQNKVGEAFDRDKVTELFFKQFEFVFNTTKKELLQQRKDEHTAHQFLHALLNRLMFIYFVQRKRWDCFADGDPEFIKTMWDIYRNGDYPKDTFYRDWLDTLFFSAFNNKHGYEHKGLPPKVVEYFKLAPYLDGGLFTYKPDYDGAGFVVTDAMFERIFTELLDAFNFTVTEDTPFDQNIAVDPEMLGIVYESLVNTTELSDTRAEAGIFYTPRVEVDFMCRRALVEHLAKHSSATRKELYQFIFPEDSDEQILPQFSKAVRDELDKALLDVTAVDPACGSGAFLVGMMQVILELRRELWKQKGNKPESFDDFKERKNIIERSLYGVDVKDWAISIAELRLWLTLIEVADERKLDLPAMKISGEALLPSLSFKLRVGDSLVQELAGVTIPIRSAKGKLSGAIQRKVTELRKLKTQFFFRHGEVTEQDIKQRELALYQAILDEQIADIDKQLQSLQNNGKAEFQQELVHVLDKTKADEDFAKHKVKEDERRKREIAEAQEEKAHLLSIRKNLAHKKQLFWSIEFAEVFQERGGFDIVIGNPPYVQQESIADPYILEAGEVPSVESKRVYKEKLARMIEDDWGKGAMHLNKRADLYVYFYLRGMALLHDGGTFVFITSNSWLDVGYGAGLQEFLLKHARVLAVYDNEVKRCFKSADVNTIIAVFEPLAIKEEPDAEHVARFVMFKQPFEEAIYSDNLLVIETASERTVIRREGMSGLQIARVVPLEQGEIYKQGLEVNDDDANSSDTTVRDDNPFSGAYAGDKWGGKYLRAPDIYWTLIESGKDKLKPLRDLGKVRRGFTTGANEYFYLETVCPIGESIAGCTYVRNNGKLEKGTLWEGWIETEFLVPVIKSPREYYSLKINDSTVLLFHCKLDATALKGKKALDYIKWGESVGYHNSPSAKGRKPWYAVRGPEAPTLLWPSAFFERHMVYECPRGYCADKVFYTITSGHSDSLKAFLNSTLVSLFVEVEGYQLNHGGIFVTTEWLSNLPVLKIPDPTLEALYEEVASRDIRLCSDELEESSRRKLDLRCLELLGVESSKLDELYAFVRAHVAGRIHKARRETTKKGRNDSA